MRKLIEEKPLGRTRVQFDLIGSDGLLGHLEDFFNVSLTVVADTTTRQQLGRFEQNQRCAHVFDQSLGFGFFKLLPDISQRDFSARRMKWR
jgi:hypothetical protein